MAKEIDIELLARGTTGFTGADLENMVNQAALRYDLLLLLLLKRLYLSDVLIL